MRGTRVLVSLALVLLAGCAERGAGSAKLDYDGGEPGTHQDTAGCDRDGQLTVISQVNEGEITVTVRDGANKEEFHDTFEGTIDGESHGLGGEEGTWTLQVDRSSDFRGSYTVTLSC